MMKTSLLIFVSRNSLKIKINSFDELTLKTFHDNKNLKNLKSFFQQFLIQKNKKKKFTQKPAKKLEKP